MGFIFTSERINEIKLAMSVVQQPKISNELISDKIWELFDLLLCYEDYDEDFGIVDMFDENEVKEKTPKFYSSCFDSIAIGDYLSFKYIILNRLIEINAFMEIIELGLDKLKKVKN